MPKSGNVCGRCYNQDLEEIVVLSVTFDPHVTSQTISPPRLSAADKGKGTEGRQDLEMEIAQAIKEGGEEAEDRKSVV